MPLLIVGCFGITLFMKSSPAHRTALYPGTFDPMTLGHLDILKRASRLCDKLVVAVAINRSKNPLFALSERVEMVENVVAPFRERIDVEVLPFEGLLIHFVESVGANMIVRGLRAVSDFEYEFQMAGMNDRLNPDIETVFLMADPQYQTIASRLVKEIARLGGDVSQFVTPEVEIRLKDKYT
ncbi:phosphopantetheine adenylyltransferase [Litorimonas taeanensis]|uniref:Phosphopantetheine adenylyltransferase n=2 Tax=Litorimonas taeanensis TaxID=568099 RepID=A0A420WKP8_9PROT|nr:phosphopantetheine adenylyltransferase [Litorimonas taeanensis]